MTRPRTILGGLVVIVGMILSPMTGLAAIDPFPPSVPRTPAYDNFDNLIGESPRCWEDEVVVLVIWDPYGDLDLNNVVGCVPADNLPVSGYRPEPN